MFQQLLQSVKEQFREETLEDALSELWQDIGADAEEASSYSEGDRELMQAEILLDRLRDSEYYGELSQEQKVRWEGMSYKQKMKMCLDVVK